MEKHKSCVDSGRSLAKRKKLHKVASIVLPPSSPESPGVVVVTAQHKCEAAASFFSKKLGCGKVNTRLELIDFVMKAEGLSLELDFITIQSALSKIKNKAKLDLFGISIDQLVLAFDAHPSAFTSWLSNQLGSTAAISSMASYSQFLGGR